MDYVRRSRGPTCVPSNVNYEYIMRSTRSTVTRTNSQVPQRNRILSDTALLPPQKKVRFATNRPNVNGASAVSRPPLIDLSTNIARNALAPAKVIRKDVRVVKTVTSENTRTVQETIESNRMVYDKYGYEINTYQSKYSSVTDYRTLPNLPPIVRKQPVATPNPRMVTIYDDTDLDDVFVDTASHYTGFKAAGMSGLNDLVTGNAFFKPSLTGGLFTSPIEPNVYVPKSAVIFQGIPADVKRPATKINLVHRTQSAGARQRNAEAISLDVCTIEYLEEIVRHQLRNDWKVTIKKNVLKANNPCKETRAATVNWLIQAHECLDQPVSVFFATIRLFDYVLGSMPVATNMYQLVGFVTMWILMKFEDTVSTLTPSKMIYVCHNAYSVQQFLKMEQKLQAFFDLDLNIPDVTLYAAYYIKLFYDENEVLLNIVYYILECYALDMDFTTVIPSMQAAAAVCLAFNILYPLESVWQRLTNIRVVAFYNNSELEDIMQGMLERIQKVQDPNYAYRQPFKKYIASERAQASIVLLKKLVAT